MAGLTERIKGAIGDYIATAIVKGAPAGVAGGMPGFAPTTDAFRKRNQPTRRGLLEVLKGFPFACATKNANGVAQVPLRLYVKTNKADGHEDVHKDWYKTIAVSKRRADYLRWSSSPYVQKFVSRSEKLEEITSHPILTALEQVNPWMNQFDLIRLTVMELDTTGEAYWFPRRNNAGAPAEIWPLESWRVRPLPSLSDDQVISSFEYAGARGSKNYKVDQLIQFRYVSPHDPYGSGYSPTRAAFEYIELANELLAYESAVVNNRARPDMLISPTDVISKRMAERYETRFNEKFRRGGGGGAMVAESGYNYTPFSWSPTNMGGMEMRRACEEVIAACFDVPLSVVRVEDVNRSNAEAGKYAHSDLAIRPRCVMIEQKLNEKFTPMFDDRLMLAFDNPVPEDADRDRAERQINLQMGVTSINRERQKIGEPEIAGGEEPLVDPSLVPLSMLRKILAEQQAEGVAPSGPGQPRGTSFGRPAAPPKPEESAGATPAAIKRYILKKYGSEVDRIVRERLEEHRLGGDAESAALWPDLPFHKESR